LLFPRYRGGWNVSDLEIDELENVVAFGKSRQQLLLVLVYTGFKIARNASVDYRISGVSKKIDAINLFHR
jgi:hypothetical protein